VVNRAGGIGSRLAEHAGLTLLPGRGGAYQDYSIESTTSRTTSRTTKRGRSKSPLTTQPMFRMISLPIGLSPSS